VTGVFARALVRSVSTALTPHHAAASIPEVSQRVLLYQLHLLHAREGLHLSIRSSPTFSDLALRVWPATFTLVDAVLLLTAGVGKKGQVGEEGREGEREGGANEKHSCSRPPDHPPRCCPRPFVLHAVAALAAIAC